MKNIFLFYLAAGLAAGCGNKEAKTYQAPKESAAPAAVETAAVNPPGNEFEATLPEGWTEKAGSGMRMASYTIEGSSVDFYLIPLMMGDVPSNVNRWRGQVGLSPASPESIAKEVESFQVDGHDVKYIEIYNEDSNWGIISAIVDLAPTYWYFTAKGPMDELQAHASDIRKFIESVKVGK